jgi:hypothetical protein
MFRHFCGMAPEGPKKNYHPIWKEVKREQWKKISSSAGDTWLLARLLGLGCAVGMSAARASRIGRSNAQLPSTNPKNGGIGSVQMGALRQMRF